MKEKSFSERHIERLDRKCRISLHEISKDHHYPLHWHEYFELEILLSGEGEHRFNGVCRSVREGDVWLMSLCDFHTYVPHSEGAILNVAFAKGFLDRECEGESTRALHVVVRCDEDRVNDVIECLHEHRNYDREGYCKEELRHLHCAHFVFFYYF